MTRIVIVRQTRHRQRGALSFCLKINPPRVTTATQKGRNAAKAVQELGKYTSNLFSLLALRRLWAASDILQTRCITTSIRRNTKRPYRVFAIRPPLFYRAAQPRLADFNLAFLVFLHCYFLLRHFYMKHAVFHFSLDLAFIHFVREYKALLE